jgi:hypothetical protein
VAERMLQLSAGQFPADLLAQAHAEWPGDDWTGWYRYDTPDERKHVCPDWKQMPEACRKLLGLMATMPPEPGSIPDLSLYGGGMHSMGPGDLLHLHLDADAHKLSALSRRFSSVLFLTPEWDASWGGEFRLWSADRQRVLSRVSPEAGVLCAFECTDTAYHEVSVISCPESVRRKGLALFWYGHPATDSHRPRAMFVNATTEQADAETERLRLERAGIAVAEQAVSP